MFLPLTRLLRCDQEVLGESASVGWKMQQGQEIVLLFDLDGEMMRLMRY